MNKYWERLGSPDAISRVTIIVVVLVQTSGSFITSLVDYTGRIPDFLVVRLGATIALIAVLTIGKLVLLSRFDTRIKPYVTLLFIFMAIVASSVTEDTFLLQTHFTTESRLASRLALSLIGLTIAMVVTALVVTALRENARQNQTLLDAAQALLTTRAEASQRIAQRRAEISQRVSAEIQSELALLEETTSSTYPEELKSLLDDVVRPLSYELERESVTDAISLNTLPLSRVQWRKVFVETVLGNPFHPVAAAAWPAATTTTFVTANFGPIGLVTGLGFFLAYATSMWLSSKLWKATSNKLNTTANTGLLILLFGVATWLATWVIKVTVTHELFVGGKEIAWIFTCEVFSWTVAMLFTANALLQRTSAALESTVSELQREVISLNTAYRRLQRGISRVLHGPVQHAIAASIYQLQSTPDAATDARVLGEVQQRVTAALELITSAENTTPDLAEAFSELSELWANVTPVDIEVSEDDLSLIQRDDHAAHAVHELVGEACVNAMKHGEASHIVVSIAVDRGARLINVRVQNNGKTLAADARNGLGSQLLDEMCISWSRTQLGEFVVTEMVLPVQL